MPLTIVATGEPHYEADPACSWLLDAVDEWRERSERPRRDPSRFHASSLGQTDEELIDAYNGTTVTFTLPAQKLRIFDNGHGVHSRWNRYLKKSGLSIKHRRQVWIPRLRLKGTCDEIVIDAEGTTWVVELKSINPFAFSQLNAPKPEHVDQLMCYMVGLRILHGMLLYESKGDQSVKVFRVDFSTDRWASIEARLLRLRALAEAMPTPEERFTPEVVAASEALLAAMGEPGLPSNDIRRAVAATGARLLS